MPTAAARLTAAPLAPAIQGAKLANELWPAGRLSLPRTLRWRAGETPRRRSGLGDHFWQWRHYERGDPLRAIDWRRSAREDPASLHPPWLRVREAEENAMLFLWADGALSMRYHSQTGLPRKQHYAQTITHSLQLLAQRSGLRAHMRSDAVWPAQPLPGAAGTLLICSDFLSGAANWQTALQPLALQGWHGILVTVLDPAERAWEFNGRLDIHAIGSAEHTVFEHAGMLLAAYQQRIEAHLLGIEQLASQLGWQYHLCITNHKIAADILHLVHQLNRA